METNTLLPLGSLLRESIEMYWADFRTFLGIAAIPSILLFVGGALAASGVALLYVVAGVLFFAGVIGYILSAMALLYAIRERGGIVEAYRSAWRNILAYGWISLLSMLMVMGGLLMGVIPGIVFSMWFVFAGFAFVYEGKEGMEALMQSREYVRGYWWGIFWRVMFAGFFLSLVAMVIEAPAYLLGKGAGDLVQAIVQCVFSPMYLLVAYKLYMNLREVKGGEVVPSKEGRGLLIFAATLPVIVPLGFLCAALITGFQIFK